MMKKIVKARAVTAFGMALIIMLTFAFPIPALASGLQQHDVSVLVLYDESYAKFVTTMIGVNPEDRLEQILDYACLSFKNTYNINLNYDIGIYNLYLGEPFSTSLTFPDECSHLWFWDLQINRPPERIWNHLNGYCDCVNNDQCYTPGSSVGHHTSGMRVLKAIYDYRQDATNQQYDAIVAFVGHKICYRLNNGTHNFYGGLTRPSQQWRATVIAGIYDYSQVYYQIDYDNQTNTDLSTYHLCNFLSNARIFQHELSHIFGAADGACSADYPCIMSGGFDGVVYAQNIWCPQCTSDFNEDLFD